MKTRYQKKYNIFVFAAVFFVAVFGFVMMSFIGIWNNVRDVPSKNVGELNLVYAVAYEGAPELAKILLEDLQSDYRPEYTLCAARLAAGTDDYQTAKALYMKAVKFFPDSENEYTAVLALCEAEKEYYGTTDFSEVSYDYILMDELKNEFFEELSGIFKNAAADGTAETESSLYSRAARYIIYANQAHDAYIRGEAVDDEIKAQLRRFNTFLQENPALSEISRVRLARLKLQILCEDYRGIAENVDGYADYNELLIVSELYLNNYIKQSNFSGDFSSENTAKYEFVYNKLDEIYITNYQTKYREERQAARAQLRALETMINNPAIGRIEEEIYKYTQGAYFLDLSKVYLQLAKIEHSLGNEMKVSEYLDRSIDTVGDCEDIDYTVPMYELVGIITDKDDPERLRNAAVYVDQVLANSMTVKMTNTGNDYDDNEAGKSLAEDFALQMQTYVNQKRMSVKIVNVDTSSFERGNTITATVNISSHLYTEEDELKSALNISDCGADITDFTINKLDYAKANILLCLDVSGSMSNNDKIVKLREAVKLFSEDMADIESIAIVTFNSRVVHQYSFGMSGSDLLSAADAVRANGGTDMYNALLKSISMFEKNPGEINSIILMSDGRDNNPKTIDDIERNIGIPCKDKGITVYSIGFGNDADHEYLNRFAAATGGAYLYANEPETTTQTNQLGLFFDSLRAQILNQYTIVFKAADTLSYSRELRITLDSGLDGDRVRYYLGGGADSMTEPDFDENSPLYMANKAVYGFEPRLLFKNGKTLNTVLKGEGFETGDNISISLTGSTTKIKWDTRSSLTDTNTVAVTIPEGIGVDVYDVVITINGKTAVIQKGLSVFMQGSEKVTDFGKYRFISYIKQEDKENNTVKLTGYVNMNGWLDFNGEITLSGDLSGGHISLIDMGGSCVYYDTINSEGLAELLGKIGLPVSMPPLGRITLYNDPVYEESNASFRVESFPLNVLDLGKYFGFGGVKVKIFPNKAEFEAGTVTADLPFANRIMKKANADFFSFDAKVNIVVSSKAVGVSPLEIKWGASTGQNTFKAAGLGNTPIYISPQSVSLKMDTMKNEYSFSFAVKLGFAADGNNPFGLYLGWKNSGNGLIPTDIRVTIPLDKVETVFAGVPVTYSNFMIGVENIDISKNPVYWTLVGGMDISAAKISSVSGLKGLSDWIGDVSVVKLDKAKVSLTLGDFYLKAEGNFKILEELDTGNITLEMGKFTYTNKLLGLKDEPASGVRLSASIGPNWKLGRRGSLKAQITGEIGIMTKFIGFYGKGEVEAELDLWIIVPKWSAHAEIFFGFRITPANDVGFLIRTSPGNVNLSWPKNFTG